MSHSLQAAVYPSAWGTQHPAKGSVKGFAVQDQDDIDLARTFSSQTASIKAIELQDMKETSPNENEP